MAEIINAGKILAFDTSAAVCSVALQNGKDIGFVHEVAPMQQAKLILPLIQSLLDSMSLTFTDLDAVAYGHGPGSFTGIRIASSVAQGIAYAANLPVVQISSLAVLAQSAFIEQKWRKLIVATDARMGEIYYGAYEVGVNDLVIEQMKDSLAKPLDVRIEGMHGAYGVGDAWNNYSDELMKSLGFQPIAVQPAQQPSARAVLALAQEKFQRGEVVAAFDAIPVYLR